MLLEEEPGLPKSIFAFGQLFFEMVLLIGCCLAIYWPKNCTLPLQPYRESVSYPKNDEPSRICQRQIYCLFYYFCAILLSDGFYRPCAAESRFYR